MNDDPKFLIANILEKPFSSKNGFNGFSSKIKESFLYS
jgi:hypothetical protein